VYLFIQSTIETHGRYSHSTTQETEEDAEFLGDTGKSPPIMPVGKTPLMRHLSGLLFSPVLEVTENVPPSSTLKATSDADNLCW